ncbi:MAG: biotin/lipoyl-containing protein, partial [Allorhizobium sp.]
MGTYTFRLPDIGEGIAEAEIVAWHVAVGDMVEEDGRLADMMTDKATVEMESPVAGKVVSIAGEVGDVVAIGSALVVIETEGEGEAQAPAPATASAPAPKAEVVEERIEAETPDAADVARVEAAAPPPPPPPPPPAASKAAPAQAAEP